MIDIQLYIAFFFIAFVLALIPGPNVSLIIANSISYGTKYGVACAAGCLLALLPQLALAVLGSSATMIFMANWFEYLKWAGVFYLLYLGFRYWFAYEKDIPLKFETSYSNKYKSVFWKGFLISSTNPKTLLFLGAFLPQFVTSNNNMTEQLSILSVTFFVASIIALKGYAIMAGAARRIFLNSSKIRNRISGSLFFASAAGLAFAKKS